MYILPPPTTEDIEDLLRWCQDLYNALQQPTFSTVILDTLTDNGYLKTTGSAGELEVDINAYITDLSSFDTSDLSEGTNLYYTDARVDSHLSGGTGIGYSTGTISLSHLGLESLTDPNADRIFVWDDSAGASTWLQLGTGLSIDATPAINVGDVEGLTTSLTAGSIPFSDGSNLAEDNSNLFWDGTNNRLGIGDSNPDATVDVIGNAFIGDDGTNYTEIKSDGEINLHGTARVTKELDFNAGSVKAPPTKSASWVAHGIKGVWEFSDATDDTVVTAINFPKDMDLSVAPTIRLCWGSTTTSGDVVWQLEYLFRQIDEDTTAVAEETLSQTGTSSATANGFTCTDFTGINIANASDRTIFVRVKRLGADASDTIGDTAELHSIIFSYTTNKLGQAT